MAIKIIIADDVLEMRELIDKMLKTSLVSYELIASCENGQEVIEVLKYKEADIVLMDINMPIMNGLEATDLIAQKYPQTNVIMMSVQHESEYLKKAMLAGAKAYIMKPVDLDELVDTIQKTYERYDYTSNNSKDLTASKKTRIISFFSGKGGVGKSVISVNVALMLAVKFDQRVLVIDLDLQFGDISLILNKQSELTIKELFDESPITEYEALKPYLYKYKDNMDVLFAPRDPEAAEYISSEQVRQIIELLKGYYDIIIFDTGVNYNEITLNALDASDQIIIITSMEVTSLKNTKMSLKVMQTLNYGQDKVKLVINMENQKYGVTRTNIEKAFNFDIISYVPEDVKTVRTSVNSGIPCVSSKNNSMYKPIFKLSQSIIDK